jgi:alpha-glucuronidase
MMLALGVMAFPYALLADAQRQAAPDQARAESAESFVNIARGSELVVSLGPNAGFAEKRAAALLIDAVTTRTGLKPTIGDPASSGHALVIGTAESHALVKEYLARRKEMGKLPADGFVVSWEPGAKRWYVAGESQSGVVAGVGRLLRMIRFEEGRMSVPATDVSDAPRMPVRGMYLWARPTYFTPQLADRLDRYIEEFALWGGNAISFWFELGMY